MLIEVPGQRLDHSGDGLDGGVRTGLASEKQVVGQGDAVPGPGGSDLVKAIGVEGDEGQCRFRRPVRRPPAGVLDDEGSTACRGRQGHDGRSHHRIDLLGILVGGEELARRMHQHRVQLGLQPASRRQPEVGSDAIEYRQEGLVPLQLVDLHTAPGDLVPIRRPASASAGSMPSPPGENPLPPLPRRSLYRSTRIG